MDIFYGIDGTGPDNDDEYRAAFVDSYVQRIFKDTYFGERSYVRGPTMSGSETLSLANAAARHVAQKYKEFQDNQKPIPYLDPGPPRIFLSGYSRGGAAVINVAAQLNAQGIPVHAMFLFDAVDRAWDLKQTDVIPSNVARCYHAMRDPKAGSRTSFGNCGEKAAVPAILKKKTFYCTHGAMGGTPWDRANEDGLIEEMDDKERAVHRAAKMSPGGTVISWLRTKGSETNVTLKQEREGTKAVWDWMSKHIKTAKASEASPMIGPIGAYTQPGM